MCFGAPYLDDDDNEVEAEFACNFDTWIQVSSSPDYIELKEVIEMRRQTTDFFDQDGLAGKAAPKIYTWDTPDKDSVNNY